MQRRCACRPRIQVDHGGTSQRHSRDSQRDTAGQHIRAESEGKREARQGDEGDRHVNDGRGPNARHSKPADRARHRVITWRQRPRDDHRRHSGQRGSDSDDAADSNHSSGHAGGS